MTATTRCPHPRWCGVSKHEVGSRAAAKCATAGGTATSPGLAVPASTVNHRYRPTPPDEVVAAELEVVRAALQANLDAADAASGWSPDSGAVHPTGGYTERSVTIGANGKVFVRHSDHGVRLVEEDCDMPGGFRDLHRSDGPAIVSYDREGKVSHEAYYQHGVGHREDGPASSRPRRDGKPGMIGTYLLDGRKVDGPSRGDDVAMAAQDAHLDKIVQWGAPQETCVHWLAYEKAAGAKDTRRLIKAEVDPRQALECAEAGIHDVKMIVSVSRGQMPISWAAAGL